jgi:oxygen-independent coproporphyrinogen-3 oxidase
LYVHVPFCFHKCHYCDFYSFVDERDQQPAFVERLVEEFKALAPHAGVLRTVFVGGGTPTLLRPALWERVLEALRACFRFEGAEFTVEANPETVTAELMRLLVSGGVNRVSVGAQSFEPRHLRTLERDHDPASVERALALAAEAGVARRSLDLIYAIPGQTLEEWARDVERAVSIGTTHLSCYNLTYEPNTAMTVRLRKGEFVPTDEETEARMFELTGERLRAAGFERYEVSNYARRVLGEPEGEACAHNLVYWEQGDWLSAGPSGSAHVAGARWKNVPRLGDYLAFSDGGFAPVEGVEPPDPVRSLREWMMTGVRLARGVDAAEAVARARVVAGERAAGALLAEAATLAGDGLLRTDGGRWRPTERGWLVADFLARRLMRSVGFGG